MPHLLIINRIGMRKLLVVSLLGLVLSSCLNKAQSDYTPLIYVSEFVRLDSIKNDTLRIRQSDEGQWRLDSLAVNDTLLFAAGFDAVWNNLQSVRLLWDTSEISVWVNDLGDIAPVLLDSSDTLTCRFEFPVGYNFVSLPFVCSPKKTGKTTIRFHLETDSKFSPVDEDLYCVTY